MRPVTEQAIPHSITARPEHSSASPLSIHDLTVAYRHKPVLWNVDLDIPEGKLVAIVGPNGAGKSTLIKAVLDLVPRISGEIEVYGKPYARQRSLVGYVPQRESVDWEFPVSALDVVAMGRYRKIGWFRRVNRHHRDAAMHALERVGLADFAHRQISQLSGGQQQRVFLARALAQESKLYLMDEPFAAVDAATEQSIVELLRELRDSGRTAVVVHHDLETVRDYFDQVILINMHVIAYGDADAVFTKENLRKTYGGRLTLLDAASDAIRKQEGKL